jgi:hypothetical protein
LQDELEEVQCAIFFMQESGNHEVSVTPPKQEVEEESDMLMVRLQILLQSHFRSPPMFADYLLVGSPASVPKIQEFDG